MEEYYKNININDYINNNINLKNLLELSTITDLYVFNKKKKLKDKRILLKECDYKRKQKVREVTSILSNSKIKNTPDIKIKLDDIEKLDSLIDTIEQTYPENKNNNYIEQFSN